VTQAGFNLGGFIMRSTKILSLFAALTLLSVTACKKPAPAPAPAPPVDDDAAKRAAEEAARKAAAEEAARRAAEEEAARKRAAEEEAARKATAEKEAAYRKAANAALKTVHFDYDKADIKEGDRAALQGVADFMKTYPQAKVEIAGHCDERGTNEYNLALGNRRAAAVLRYLVSLGAEESHFSTISYGKEKPICTESKESCFSQNRRGEFSLK
jgi:peptidoglycan-associated lipoprotein